MVAGMCCFGIFFRAEAAVVKELVALWAYLDELVYFKCLESVTEAHFPSADTLAAFIEGGHDRIGMLRLLHVCN